MTGEDMLRKAVRLLAEAASPRRIILFGSCARGSPAAAGEARDPPAGGEDSDLDFIVIKDRVDDRRAEVVALLRVLEPHGIPADVFVASEEFYDLWKDVPGTILHEAARSGRIVYEAA